MKLNNKLQGQFEMGGKNSKQDKLNNFMSEYEIIQQIQSENLIFLQHKRSNEEFLLREFSFNDRKQFDKTYANLKLLEGKLGGSKHVVPLKDYLTTSEDQYCSTFYKIYALFQYPQRTLDDQITQRNLQKRKFAQTQLWSILASCILGLSHLQKNGIKHAALKSRNILLSRQGIIKISDPFATGQQSNYEAALTKRSTPHIYLPPQQANSLQQQIISPTLNTFKGDIWTMGMIILQAGLLQYQDQCYRDEWSRVHWETVHYNINRFGQIYSEELKNMLEFMLSKEEKMRPDWIELEEHVMKNNDQTRNSLQKHHQTHIIKQLPSEISTPQDKFLQRPSMNQPLKLNQGLPPTSPQIQVHTVQSPKTGNSARQHVNLLGNSPNIQRNTMGGMSFGSIVPATSSFDNSSQIAPIKQSLIDSTRPLRNIFPKSVYTTATRVDENLVMVDDGDDQSNYIREGNSQMTPSYNLHSQQQKFVGSLPPNFNTFGNQPKVKATSYDNMQNLNNPYEPKFVVETFKLGSKYEGYKLNGMRHGTGKFYYQDGGMYDGEWNQNKMEGYGKLYYQSGKLAYEGEWKADQFTGKGILYNQLSDQLVGSFDFRNFDEINQFWTKYEGDFYEDLKNGKGILYFSNGQKYDGEFVEDAIHGYGRFFKKNGQVVSGRWDNNQLVY